MFFICRNHSVLNITIYLIMLENHKRSNTVNRSFSATLSGNMFLSTFPVYCCWSWDPLVVQPPACTTTRSPPNIKGLTIRRRVTGVMNIIPLARPLWQRHTRGFTRWQACVVTWWKSCHIFVLVMLSWFVEGSPVSDRVLVCVLVFCCFWILDCSIYNSHCTI